MITWDEYRKTKCPNGCGKGSPVGMGRFHYVDANGKDWSPPFPCGAGTREQFEEELCRTGANEMLDNIRGSLRGYPNGGGDIEIMREVERIVAEATAELEKRREAAWREFHELSIRAGRHVSKAGERMADLEREMYWVLSRIPGKALRDIGIVYSDGSSLASYRTAIQDAMQSAEEQPFLDYSLEDAILAEEEAREHEYLDDIELAAIKQDAEWYESVPSADVLRLISDLEAMRSVYREKNPCGHYKRFQIVDTDPESACAACEIDRICREYSDLEAQLEAMRAEKEKDRLRVKRRGPSGESGKTRWP